MEQNEMLQLILTGINQVSTKVDNLQTKVDNLEIKVDNLDKRVSTLEKSQKTLENQMTSMEFRLTNKINGLYDENEVLKDSIRRIDKAVHKLTLSDEDKELRLRTLMAERNTN